MFSVAWTGRVGNDGRIGDGCVTLVDLKCDFERGLQGRFIKAGKGTAGIQRFKLRDGAAAPGSFGEIEAEEFVVQNAAEVNGDRSLALRQSLGNRERGLLLVVVDGHGGRLLLAAGSNAGRLKGNLDRVEGDRGSGLLDRHFDRLDAHVSRSLQIRGEAQNVGLRADVVR